MTNIGVDLRILNNTFKTGIGRYSYNLFNQLLKFNEEKYYVVGDIIEEKFSKANCINIDLPNSNNDLANKILSLMGYIYKLDVLHSPYFPIPKRRTFKGILTIHDLIPLRKPEWFANRSVYDFFDIEIRDSVQYIDHIIADSQSTKNDIIDLFAVDENKISVVYLGVDQNLIDMLSNTRKYDKNILEKYNINSNYILSVCTVEPRKNILRTLKSYEVFRERYKEKIKLVLVGKLGWKYESLLQMIKESKFSDDIIITGYVPDEDLPILYRNAEAFMYPSLYEGFGLPVLEAMACEAPVITSNVSSLPEVGGDSAMYCDPYDIESIVHAMEEVLTKPTLRKELRERGKIRSQQFSWKKAAEQTRQIYLDCLK